MCHTDWQCRRSLLSRSLLSRLPPLLRVIRVARSVTPRSNQDSLLQRGLRWLREHPRATLVLAVLICLGPFVAKPIHLDDPVYIWVGRHILSHPLDPYGFMIHWSRTAQPVYEAMQNPPLTCYYVALVGAVFGWSEVVLHAAFLLPAIGVVLGTYELARRLCAQPLFAALATLLTPVALVSGTTLTCDIMMLAFWVWAVVLWDRGLERDRPWLLAGAGVLAALAAMTKYFGVCLLPLLGLHALLRQRRAGWWLIGLLIPVAVVLAYQLATARLYGHGLIFAAGDYAMLRGNKSQYSLAAALIGTLTFTGGGLAWALFATPMLWRPLLSISAAAAAALAAVLFHFEMGYDAVNSFTGSSAAWVGVQVAFWTLAGATVVGLAISDVRRHATPAAWLLLCWVAGTMIFAGFVNWTLNGRSVLPLVPAAAILLARRLDWLVQCQGPQMLRRTRWALLPGALIALVVARADHQWAVANQIAAETVHAKSVRVPGNIWFTGHWGFQYYMMKGRGQPLDILRSNPQAGDLLVMPINNATVDVPQMAFTQPLVRLQAAGPSWVATVSQETGAGFYSSIWGPLPYGFGRVPLEDYFVLKFVKAVPPIAPR